MTKLFQFIFRYKKTAALLLCALSAAVFLLLLPHPHKASTNPVVTTPVFAVEKLETWNPKSLYYTVSAQQYLATHKPEWVSANNIGQDPQNLFASGQDPTLWRKLDHQYHFDAVLLCGNPSEYQPLLEHLLASKDWTLAYLDHTSIIFRRSPATPWNADDFHALGQKFEHYPSVDRACYLTQSASKLLAIGQKNLADVAKQQLDASLLLDWNYPDTWTQLALYEMECGRPADGLKDTDHALKLDKNDYSALSARAKILFSMKRFGEALGASAQLVKGHPDDPSVLFYHALIAHEAHSYTQEIETLRHLIDIASAQKRPVAGFRIYLAQAYARDGQAQPSLDEFQRALDEGGLSDEQRKFIEETMQHIKDETSL